MTLDEFIAELEKTPRDWHVNKLGAIRRREYRWICPWIEIEEKPDDEIGRKIWRAADKRGDHDPALRSRLLAACGIKE